MNLIYYSSCADDESILQLINEYLQMHSLASKASFSLIALYEVTKPERITIQHSFESKLIELLMQLTNQEKLAIVRAVLEETSLLNYHYLVGESNVLHS